jgi:predicted RecA/RadA family phage recombinase
MASLVTKKDLDSLVTNIGGPLEVVSGCSKGQVLRVLSENKLEVADNSVSDSLGKVVGVALRDCSPGCKVEFQFLGTFTMETDQSWVSGVPVYFDSSGNLTQTPPSSNPGDFIQILGVALNVDTVFLFREPSYPF